MIKSRRISWRGIEHAWWIRNAYKIVIGKPDGKRPLGKPRYRWNNNTKMNLKKLGLGIVGCIMCLMIANGCGLL
jgi:hypothetical protein